MGHEGLRWIKSSYSGGSGTECVEVAALATRTAVRDSKVPGGPRIDVPRAAWAGFVQAVQRGEFSPR
ncbi:DUF397 domain-containing protein [Streptomyces sp. H27-C3]|uniref:DUF397 domain-containing protein n=1 Tax=Streptomyces sp. H27-C3 TaxID=3046305 RepID=UPI0024B9930A|nr:DUF397 domain-containing protein [Streptomyces sp. H27-C3]MDJ0461101.1 DUF397 domain-containing protein [Streptomyces sp. H27-C3]